MSDKRDTPLDVPSADHQQNASAASPEYRVLARKYRPSTFEELIGQEAMVRTLSNAIEAGRLAHAFILTGVRGVGKTTTARLIAKALNCVGADGTGGPTVSSCGVCDNCRAIAESRHVDVLEMDAASRTGVDDIREIIDGVRYAAISARYKIYIIDEVHMLSRNAFNALLKTLEEPPAHVKFIFATTEIRKVPVTVLSRCQRFDLKRVEASQLVAHFKNIVELEKGDIEDPALGLIARAAEGSVRDGLSLLDQALAHGSGKVSETQVRDMLGLADRAIVLDLYQAVMNGDIKSALDMMRQQYNQGADPTVILQDMLELTHWLTRLKVVPDAGEDAVTSQAERELGGKMAQSLGMPILTRSWQMLLKGLQETRQAPAPLAAAEMVLVRMVYAASLPDPADLVRQLSNSPANSGSGSVNTAPSGGSATASTSQNGTTQSGNAPSPTYQSDSPQGDFRPGARAYQQGSQAAAIAVDQNFAPNPRSFPALVAMFENHKEPRLALHLSDHVHLVHFAPNRLEIRPSPEAPADLANRVSECLKQWTGERWVISLSQEAGEESLHNQELEARAKVREEALAHPLVQAALKVFEGADISDIRIAAESVDIDDIPIPDDDKFGLDDD